MTSHNLEYHIFHLSHSDFTTYSLQPLSNALPILVKDLITHILSDSPPAKLLIFYLMDNNSLSLMMNLPWSGLWSPGTLHQFPFITCLSWKKQNHFHPMLCCVSTHGQNLKLRKHSRPCLLFPPKGILAVLSNDLQRLIPLYFLNP